MDVNNIIVNDRDLNNIIDVGVGPPPVLRRQAAMTVRDEHMLNIQDTKNRNLDHSLFFGNDVFDYEYFKLGNIDDENQEWRVIYINKDTNQITGERIVVN